jgi:FAD dependent oxidoreductase
MSEAYDIAVVGAGAAGIAAAVSAARAGCATLLLDSRAAAGGTGGFSGLTTLCGLFDDEGKYLNEGFAREFAGMLAETPPLQMGKVWVLPYRPERFREAAAALLAATPNLQTRWNTPLTGAVVESDRVVAINDIRVGAVIDCSGTAEVARAIGAECLATDETTQAPAVIFRLENVTRELKTSASVTQVLLPMARAGLPPLSFQPLIEPNCVSIKFSGLPEQAPALIEYLQTRVHGFENCRALQTEFTLARRAGRMIVGQYLLTGADVLAGRKFDDAVARGAWPIEQWNAGGQPRLRYLPAGAHYEIPARSLRAAGVQNLFMAGKVISADVDGIASARVMGCCLATGATAGNLAATSLTGVPPGHKTDTGCETKIL